MSEELLSELQRYEARARQLLELSSRQTPEVGSSAKAEYLALKEDVAGRLRNFQRRRRLRPLNRDEARLQTIFSQVHMTMRLSANTNPQSARWLAAVHEVIWQFQGS